MIDPTPSSIIALRKSGTPEGRSMLFGQQHRAPALGGVDVAGTKRTPLQVAELVEHEQRMVAGTSK